ncbi:amino acid/amide ABC transporter ATP-binding protein 1 (HAAT family) [Shimia isoporae]|uniref:Amino acid/amide ABC transporter ATP-binding protein 1 (HAAT family) n=1 Tax=Shimia isoporae TaxID=647720 RepID=A0A4R1NYC0_9RHOB|nr:ABC transporter ATP-binding protein [Shimia isoporae]TCL10278.1 amino acid/amide ABC transporter ATP-binding protein 1 (HAAT family) [Shimia isoporae]
MTDPVLDVQGVTKAFGGLVASKNIDLDLRQGEIHALIGPNGAGKSTLVQQVTGGLTPDSGRIVFDGHDVGAMSTAKRAQFGMARTFQISSLAMEYTVLQNAMLGALGRKGKVLSFFKNVMRELDLRSAAELALEQVGLSDFQSVRTADLSHGQRRQLEVAVALTLSPKAFLMDEPMAGMGADGSRSLIRILDALRDRAPILLIEHDMDAVFALADRVSVLVYGEIIATGSVHEIRANPDVRRAYLGEEVG